VHLGHKLMSTPTSTSRYPYAANSAFRTSRLE
jgi:hypothetical protein